MQEDGIKLLIVGSRKLKDFDISLYIPKNVTHILSGGAEGVDTLAEQYADRHKISKTILYPRYDLYKKGAPLVRNDQLVDMCDRVLAFWDGKSRGTKHTIDYARKVGKPVNVITEILF